MKILEIKLKMQKLITLITLLPLLIFFVKVENAEAGDDRVVKRITGRVLDIGTDEVVRNGYVRLFKVTDNINSFISETDINESGSFLFKNINLFETDEFRLMAYPSDEIENESNTPENFPVYLVQNSTIVNNTIYQNIYVEWNPIMPTVKLYQNYPNPFNPFTTIEFTLPHDANVFLGVYDTNGKLLRVLINGPESSGEKRVFFNGNGLASGIYLCKLRVGVFLDYKLMTLLK